MHHHLKMSVIFRTGIFLLCFSGPLFSQANKFEVSGYGEILYRHFDYGPDQKSGENGSPSDSRAIMDIPRFVLELEYNFTNDLYFEVEVEFEHGGTGSALELEYDEFGEYEFESEKGGEVVLEGFHITKSFSPAFNARLGHFILPIGLLNKAHHPNEFFTSVRPESETALIPTTWHETGAEIFGSLQDFSYRLQVVNGLDATGFTSKNWIVEGHQRKFESVQASDLALVARLDYSGVPGLLFGASFYRGNSTDNRPKEDMAGIDGHVTIADVHGTWQRGPVIARGLLLYGALQNADLISEKNNRLSRNLQVPRTPVAKAALLWYGELGYDVLSLLDKKSPYRLFPFARYEYYNSMEEVNAGIFADPRFKRHVFTAGLNFFLTPEVVLKADYSHRTLGLDRYNDENTLGLSLGMSGTFFELGD